MHISRSVRSMRKARLNVYTDNARETRINLRGVAKIRWTQRGGTLHVRNLVLVAGFQNTLFHPMKLSRLSEHSSNISRHILCSSQGMQKAMRGSTVDVATRNEIMYSELR